MLENKPEFDAFVVVVHLRDNKFYIYKSLVCNAGDFMNEDNFTYATSGWKDKLTSFNSKDITYDTAGNPLTYGTWKMEWTAGRQLKRVDSNVATKGSLDFTYNENGLRTSKTLVYTNNGIENTEITKYDWIDGKLMSQSKPYMTLFFFYDGDELVGCSDGTNSYVYEKNLQGDVLGLIDNTGAKVVEYKYSPYGDTLRTYAAENSWDLAYANPFRYRGYIQDSDFTGWYYCQSRYYVPQWGRFLNADTTDMLRLDTGNLVTSNAFAYCENNPIMNVDHDGHMSLKSIMAAIINAVNKVLAKVSSYLKTLIVYDKRTHTLKISSTVIAGAVDAIIAFAISKAVSLGLKGGMKLILKHNKKVAESFVGEIFRFFTLKGKGKAGPYIFGQIVKWGLILAGKGSGNATKLVEGFLSNILLSKTKVLQKVASLASAFSSIGGIIGFMLDLSDKKWDDYCSIKF